MFRTEQENTERDGRFVLYENETLVGELSYRWSGKSKFIIMHTGVEAGHEGKGIGKRLVMKAVEYARANQLKIIPICPYARKVFDSDPDLDDVRH